MVDFKNSNCLYVVCLPLFHCFGCLYDNTDLHLFSWMEAHRESCLSSRSLTVCIINEAHRKETGYCLQNDLMEMAMEFLLFERFDCRNKIFLLYYSERISKSTKCTLKRYFIFVLKQAKDVRFIVLKLVGVLNCLEKRSLVTL